MPLCPENAASNCFDNAHAHFDKFRHDKHIGAHSNNAYRNSDLTLTVRYGLTRVADEHRRNYVISSCIRTQIQKAIEIALFDVQSLLIKSGIPSRETVQERCHRWKKS